MGIQKDAGELLALMYENKLKGNEHLNTENLMKLTDWSKDKVIFGLEYLISKNLIEGKAHRNIGSTKTAFIMIRDITHYGIDVIEDEKKFEAEFGFTIGLPGLFSFSFGVK